MFESFRPAVDAFVREHPEDWRKVYPRIYSEAGGYNSARDVAVDLLAALYYEPRTAEREGKQLSSQTKMSIAAAAELVAHRVPVYYIAPQLIEVLVQTRPPEPLDWVNMRLPFEAAAFVFPKGTFQHSTDGECGYLYYARLRAGHTYTHPFNSDTFKGSEDRLVFRTTLGESLATLTHNVTASSCPLLSLNDLWRPAFEIPAADRDSINLNPSDTDLLQSVISLSMGAVLAMLARPDLISPGRACGKKSKMGSEFWEPNIIGHRYRITRHSTDPDHSGISPRMHWRRGHFRSQPHGPEQSLRKIIWIEPVLVAAGSEEAQSYTVASERAQQTK
jgi:hypothetical protein